MFDFLLKIFLHGLGSWLESRFGSKQYHLKPRPIVIYIIWIAFIQAGLIYAALTFFFPFPQPSNHTPHSNSIVQLLSLMSVPLAIGGIITGFVMRPRTENLPDALIRWIRQRMIVQAAFFEAVAIMGLVGRILGRDKTVSLVYCAVGLVLLLSLLPGLVMNMEKHRKLEAETKGNAAQT